MIVKFICVCFSGLCVGGIILTPAFLCIVLMMVGIWALTVYIPKEIKIRLLALYFNQQNHYQYILFRLDRQ
jgi:hypothetical protein